MPKELSYIRLLTNNYPETFDFYLNKLNLKLKFGDKNGPYCEFETGRTDIALFDKEEMSKALGRDLNSDSSINSNIIIIFPVEDVDTEFNRLKSLDVKFLTAPETKEDWDVRVVHCLDPEGNLIELNTRIDQLLK